MPRLDPLCSPQPTLGEATTKAEMGHEPTSGQALLYLFRTDGKANCAWRPAARDGIASKISGEEAIEAQEGRALPLSRPGMSGTFTYQNTRR